jgi:uncharacterized membrane protein YphA (DoxX/SURF4 family)
MSSQAVAVIATATQVALCAALALVFTASAVPKLRHPRGFVLAVLEYRVLPVRFARVYARLVPPAELLAALLLLTGAAVRSAALMVALLLLSFLVGVGVNLARGRDLDCHCFGKSGNGATQHRIGWGLLLRECALLGAALVVLATARQWAGTEPWSVLSLARLVGAGSLWPLIGCIVATAVAAALLGRLDRGGWKQWRPVAIGKPVTR